jgi:hypothetical protein
MLRTSAWFLFYPLVFFSVFAFFQNETCYRIFSPPTYARTESGIVSARQPYAPWTDENHRHWDVVYYEVLKDEGYDSHGGLYPYKQAFFPLFSYL